jgi:flagellin-specific chaperone FliS
MDMNEEQKDELERKIDEAEMEALFEDTSPGSSFEENVPEVNAEAQKEEKKPSKARLIFRRILIWLVVIAITFAGGFFVDSYLRYQPALKRIDNLVSELGVAEENISDLEIEVERLSLFEEKNQVLEEDLKQETIHLTLLSARVAVADATLALEQNQIAETKLALDKVGSSLEDLKGILSQDQAEVVENMLQRQQLILIELEDDEFSAQTDLHVLASKLSTLENTLFAIP